LAEPHLERIVDLYAIWADVCGGALVELKFRGRIDSICRQLQGIVTSRRDSFLTSWIWWLAWRQFSARRHGSGLSFMTTVSVIGVAIGVGALVVVLSVMGGFEQDLRRKMLSGEPHIEIIAAGHALAGFSLKEHPLKEFRLAFPKALAIEPFVSGEVVLKRRGFVTAATVFGVREEAEGSKLWAFDGAFADGEWFDLFKLHRPRLPQQAGVIDNLPGIALGDQLALQIGADIGDEITALSPQASSSGALAGGTLARRYVVTGKISTGLFNYDSKWAVVALDEGRYFMPDYDASLKEADYVTGIAMNVPDPLHLDPYEKQIKNWADLAIKTWQITNKPLLFALKLEKVTMGSILMLVVLVAAFSISGTMIMTVFHKHAEVSILRSMGMSQKEIAKLFLAHGFTLGTVGVFLGLAGGITLCLMIKFTTFVPLPAGMYYLKTLPVRFLPFDYFVISACAWIFALMASTYPAIAASRQNPSDGVRYE
jgi:lipoprotein-releasing system permease protein